MKASPGTHTHVKRQAASFSAACHQVKGLNHCFLAGELRRFFFFFFLCLLTTAKQVYSDINLIFSFSISLLSLFTLFIHTHLYTIRQSYFDGERQDVYFRPYYRQICMHQLSVGLAAQCRKLYL